ncbi:MAG: tail fiber domain-containing protein [Marinilabiliaceae bacterium]|nr:tail fiber domain-containing protein [Marinilabiliaceae bacterium]
MNTKNIKILISVALMAMCAFNMNAQVKVESNGKVIMGTEYSGDDALNILSAHINGPYGTYHYGGKLAFGDFGSTSGWNALIGEYGNYDSDRLWLHGKNGIYLTRGSDGSTIIGYYDVSNGNKFTFNCDVYSYSTKLTSDERFKTNVKGLDSALVKLNKLNGVSYNYNFPNGFGQKSIDKVSSSADTNIVSTELTDKEKKDKEFFEKYDKENKDPKGKRLGFIAQDLQKVFPELVDQDSAGYFYVDYVGLIPVIIEALKEQQSIIDAQSLKIKELEDKVKGTSTKENKNANLKSASVSPDTEILDVTTNAFLFQNTPNPFTYNTEIKYYLPEGSNNAVLYVFNLQGNLLMTEKISGTGNGSITINGSELNPGMYVYSLLIDGQEVATKRMILTD